MVKNGFGNTGYYQFQITFPSAFPFNSFNEEIVNKHQESKRKGEKIDHTENHESRIPVYRIYKHQPNHKYETGCLDNRGQEFINEDIRQGEKPHLFELIVEKEFSVVGNHFAKTSRPSYSLTE